MTSKTRGRILLAMGVGIMGVLLSLALQEGRAPAVSQDELVAARQSSQVVLKESPPLASTTAAPRVWPSPVVSPAPIRSVDLPPVHPALVEGDILMAGNGVVAGLIAPLAIRFGHEGYAGRINTDGDEQPAPFAGQLLLDATRDQVGFARFCQQAETDIAMASRAITPSEVAACRAMGREPIAFPLAHHVVALVVSSRNPFLTNLSSQQVTAIFSGQATTWDVVDPRFPSDPIQLVSSTPGSDLFTFFSTTFLGTVPDRLASPTARYEDEMSFFVSAMAEDPLALGYTHLSRAQDYEDRLRIISLDGVAPTKQAVQSGAYPLTRSLSLYSAPTILQAKPQVAAFLNFVLTRLDIRFPGSYIPISPAQMTQAKQQWLTSVGPTQKQGLAPVQATQTARATKVEALIADPPMVRVPAGDFLMGSTYTDVVAWNHQWIDLFEPNHPRPFGYSFIFSDELYQFTAFLPEFEIDQYEVTEAQYRRCVQAKGCAPSNGYRHAEADYPVLVPWEQADAFCRWAGKRLPTEAEWEKAARGTDGRLYPWGDRWEPTHLNPGQDRTPVGHYPAGASPYGALDMVGNAPEWVADLYAFYPHHALPPQAKRPVDRHFFRGGTPSEYAYTPELYFRVAARGPSDAFNFYVPSQRQEAGIRCVRGGEALPRAQIIRGTTPPPTLAPVAPPDLTTMVLVPAGEFLMGATPEQQTALRHPAPLRRVALEAFYLDQYEVTQAQFAAFLNALGRHKWACQGVDCWHDTPGENWRTAIQLITGRYTPPAGAENVAVSTATWYGALAYCQWQAKRLPTNAEWGKAARGTDGRLYPWGNEWPSDSSPIGSRSSPAAVGSHPLDVSPYHIFDLLGNAPEWTWDGDAVASQATPSPQIETWWFPTPALRSRRPDSPGAGLPGKSVVESSYYAGFRCAADAR